MSSQWLLPKLCFFEGDQYQLVTKKIILQSELFLSQKSSTISLQYLTKHQLAIFSAKGSCKQCKDFEEVVKSAVGNFRSSWIINTVYE